MSESFCLFFESLQTKRKGLQKLRRLDKIRKENITFLSATFQSFMFIVYDLNTPCVALQLNYL